MREGVRSGTAPGAHPRAEMVQLCSGFHLPFDLGQNAASLQLLFSLLISVSFQYVRHMIQGAEIWLKVSPESPFGNGTKWN